MTSDRLTAALADRYRIEREPRHDLSVAKERGRPRPACGMATPRARRREGAPHSAHSPMKGARVARGGNV